MNIDIKHIAELSRLKIDEDKLEKFEEDMQKIVSMVDKLPDINDELKLDTSNPLRLREDKAVTGKFSRDELLANAASVQAGCLVVPKTIE